MNVLATNPIWIVATQLQVNNCSLQDIVVWVCVGVCLYVLARCGCEAVGGCTRMSMLSV